MTSPPDTAPEPLTAPAPLAGYTVAVTAARRREELGALLDRRGARVVYAPAIRIVPLSDDAELVAATLAPGGVWRLATDWDDYARQMRRVLDAHPAFEPVPGSGTRWPERPLTKFEQRGLDAGREITDLGYRRR